MTDTVDSVVPVTQEDRDAAAGTFEVNGEWHSGLPNYELGVRMQMGLEDDHPLVQAFARHRLTAERKHEAEIAAQAAKIERMRKTLEWYANLKNWGVYLNRYDYLHRYDKDCRRATNDRGRRARQALGEIQ